MTSTTVKRSGALGKRAPTSRQRHIKAERLDPEERAAGRKAARAKVPLEAHVTSSPRSHAIRWRYCFVAAETRVPELVPIRHGRMLVSPFSFYRGAALMMAADLDTTPTPGLRTQLCGDAHLSNFGAYASPERQLVFDINDFDETLPGPFEWDVKRLAASFVVAGRDNGFTAGSNTVRQRWLRRRATAQQCKPSPRSRSCRLVCASPHGRGDS